MNPARAELYALCEREDVGLTVMKGFAGGRLFDAARSPFGVALTPVQCIHYALTRPAKFYDLTVMQDEVPASVREHYRALSVRADTCVACRACETRCPFGVSIAERMGQAATLFA